MAFLLAGSILLSLILVTLLLTKVTFRPKHNSTEFDELTNSTSLSVVKKYATAKIDTKRSLYFFSGLLIALIFSVVLIEYKTEIIQQEIFSEKTTYEDSDDVIFIPIVNQTPPPPPQKTTPIVLEVPNETIIENPIIEFSTTENIETNTLAVFDDIPEEKPEDIQIFDGSALQQQAIYPGGFEKLLSDIANNFNGYLLDGTTGKIFVEFVVEKDGSISNVKVLRGLNKKLDNEAIRVISKSLARWTPGMNQGMPVRVRYAIPIKIQ